MKYSKELHKKARKIVVADSLTDKEVFALLDEIERLQTFEKAVDEWSNRVDAKLDNVTVKSNQVIQLMEHYRSECARLQKLHEWIPVTPDTMPEYGYRVLVVSEGEVEIGWVNNINKVKTFNLPNVTKWQPLPPQEQP
jgi:hypothetical protein